MYLVLLGGPILRIVMVKIEHRVLFVDLLVVVLLLLVMVGAMQERETLQVNLGG